MTHRLQAAFNTAQGEASYVDALAALIEAGQLDAADAILTADLAGLDSDLARRCVETPRTSVVLSGWEALVEAVSVYQGDPITCIAIGMGNDADLVFDRDVLHVPFLTLGFYADGPFAFSSATRDSLLAQCKTPDPAWSDTEEDIEVYLELEGLAEINTALICHKHCFFFRDDDTIEAPAAYVEQVLVGWFRALRFHQAVAAEMDDAGLPGGIPAISGIFGMRPDIATVHYPERSIAVEVPQVASLVIKPKPREAEVVAKVSGPDLRRRLVAQVPVEPVKQGFLARIFATR
jgi:hypothetical protein